MTWTTAPTTSCLRCPTPGECVAQLNCLELLEHLQVRYNEMVAEMTVVDVISVCFEVIHEEPPPEGSPQAGS